MQNNSSAEQHSIRILPVLLAGLAGGLAEIIWVSLYSATSTVSAAEIARQVTVTVLPSLGGGTLAPLLGIAIHLLLSVCLAAGFAVVLLRPVLRRFGTAGVFISAPLTLALIWAVNFFILLPLLNPVFPHLMPYTVTLASKLLFGMAMAGVYAAATARTQGVISAAPM